MLRSVTWENTFFIDRNSNAFTARQKVLKGLERRSAGLVRWLQLIGKNEQLKTSVFQRAVSCMWQAHGASSCSCSRMPRQVTT